MRTPMLTVIHPFAGYSAGDTIDDPKAAAEVLASEHAGHVVATPAKPRRTKE